MNNKVLLKDIVIPRGTVFTCIDGELESYIDGCYRCIVGLTKNTCGDLVYDINENDFPEVEEWFTDLK